MVTGNTELGREAVYHIWHEVTVGDVGVARQQGQAVRGAQPQLRGAGPRRRLPVAAVASLGMAAIAVGLAYFSLGSGEDGEVEM